MLQTLPGAICLGSQWLASTFLRSICTASRLPSALGSMTVLLMLEAQDTAKDTSRSKVLLHKDAGDQTCLPWHHQRSRVHIGYKPKSPRREIVNTCSSGACICGAYWSRSRHNQQHVTTCRQVQFDRSRHMASTMQSSSLRILGIAQQAPCLIARNYLSTCCSRFGPDEGAT